jgi:hypothetical protein
MSTAFNPRCALLSKQHEGEKVRRVYDPAKTPLQRLLLSGVLPADRQQELSEVFQTLDPLSLLQHLEDLQHALWRCALTPSLLMPSAPSLSLLLFSIARCMPGPLTPQQRRPAAVSVFQRLQSEQPSEVGLLDWPRTTRDPFEGEWEAILALVLTHHEHSLSDLFQELQHRSPGRYQPSHLETLQRGVCKIRARLQALIEEPWPHEVIQEPFSTTVSAEPEQREQEADHTVPPLGGSLGLLSSFFDNGPRRSKSSAA